MRKAEEGEDGSKTPEASGSNQVSKEQTPASTLRNSSGGDGKRKGSTGKAGDEKKGSIGEGGQLRKGSNASEKKKSMDKGSEERRVSDASEKSKAVSSGNEGETEDEMEEGSEAPSPSEAEDYPEAEEAVSESSEAEEEKHELHVKAKRKMTLKPQKLAPNPDSEDPENLVMQIMMQQPEDEAVEVVFMEAPVELEAESIATFPGVVGLKLSEPTAQFLELDLTYKYPPYTYISLKRIKLHIYMYQEASEFYQFRDVIMHYPDARILIGADLKKETGQDYFICTTLEGRNMVLHPPKLKKVYPDIKKKDELLWLKYASLAARKWRSLGSDLEIELESTYQPRPLITMYAYRYIENFNRPYEFTDTQIEGNPDAIVGFPSIDRSKIPLLEIAEKDVGVQAMAPKSTNATQTGFSFKRNRITQYENQFLPPETARPILNATCDTLVKKTKALQRALLQNEMMNLSKNDYKLKALKGHEVEYSEESVLLEHYHTYNDVRHTKGRCATWMAFHPTLDDVVVIAMGDDATVDKRIDFHSKRLMEPNFVLFWDLKDPVHPQIMLDAPSDVFCFMINPSDPQLICGGCANGQIALWDLGHEYLILKSRVQGRRRKTDDKGSKALDFLDKLKDNSEKYVCPLVSPVGLSNLDQSHKKLVSSVVWIPPHIELGKNGTVYENLTGKSAQFFSAAGDGTIRLWDTRPPKAGIDELDEKLPSEVIRSSAYLHLENNNWKFLIKYQVEDGTGSSVFVTTLSLSEPRIGDIISFDTLTRRASHRSSSAASITSSGTGDGDDVGNVESLSKHDMHMDPQSEKLDTLSGGFGETGVVDDEDEDPLEKKEPEAHILATDALSTIFVGSEVGQVGLIDWFRNKEGPISIEGGQRTFNNIFLETIHDGAVTCIARSPFYYSLVLVIGGGTVSIWTESSSHPLLAMAGSDQFPWCACWSNTRPAVFFVGTREGALQVWDLTEKSHAPVLVQQISGDRITGVAIPKAKLAKKQFLALSDSGGNLFAMLLSGYYYKTNSSENSFMIELMSREEKRMVAWLEETENRNQRIDAIHNAWKESRLTKTAKELAEIEAEEETRLNAEYLEFVEYESELSVALKQTEPTLSVEEMEVDEEFQELMEAAKAKERELRELAAKEEEGEDEDEELETASSTQSIVSLDSEFGFLMKSRGSSLKQLEALRKSSQKSTGSFGDSYD